MGAQGLGVGGRRSVPSPALDRRGFLKRVGGGGMGVALVGAPGGFAAGRSHTSRNLHEALEQRVAASGARGQARVWWSADTDDRVVALTFDDGPTDLTPQVLDVLARYDAPATFFVIGALAARRPDLVTAVHEAGHEVGNHTYDHVGAERMGPDEVRANVERGADAVAEVVGDRPRWLRPVKGHVTGSLLRAAAAVGHDVAIWSLTRGPRSLADDDTVAVRRHLVEGVHPGAIALLHDGVGASAVDPFGSSERLALRRATELAVLPQVVEHWLEEGYRFVTLSQLIDEHDQPVAAPGPSPRPQGAPDPSAVDAEAVAAGELG